MLQAVLAAACIGGIMGLLGHIKRKGRLEKPRMTKRFVYLGFWEDIFVGIAASILLVLSSEPQSSLQLVILSIVAGYSGDAVLKSFDFVRQKEETEPPPEHHKKHSPHS
ncbi:DUF4257 domain-containing protein [Metabacillus sp. GX 13764]|uniref:DUF4257 domain-containing protein n=1 Tax=Metabacillus kandeliae TaxID=2900151 RepID=UPI001E2F1F95|nr:DUF4257 domain-containing protein [Metabacillus kandeliae]MCD7032674.1 DUF4257 domain-containing protein [Metabacillus kandeliae]